MSVRINCSNKEILHVKNAVLRCIYFNICDYIEQSKIVVPENIDKFLEEDLYLATEGQDLNIVDSLKTKDEILFFAALVKTAIEKEQSGPTPFIDEVEKILTKFHNEIVTCAIEI